MLTSRAPTAEEWPRVVRVSLRPNVPYLADPTRLVKRMLNARPQIGEVTVLYCVVLFAHRNAPGEFVFNIVLEDEEKKNRFIRLVNAKAFEGMILLEDFVRVKKEEEEDWGDFEVGEIVEIPRELLPMQYSLQGMVHRNPIHTTLFAPSVNTAQVGRSSGDTYKISKLLEKDLTIAELTVNVVEEQEVADRPVLLRITDAHERLESEQTEGENHNLLELHLLRIVGAIDVYAHKLCNAGVTVQDLDRAILAADGIIGRMQDSPPDGAERTTVTFHCSQALEASPPEDHERTHMLARQSASYSDLLRGLGLRGEITSGLVEEGACLAHLARDLGISLGMALTKAKHTPEAEILDIEEVDVELFIPEEPKVQRESCKSLFGQWWWFGNGRSQA